MPNREPDISVIIGTYNRADILRECLQSLEKQSVTPDRYEVLVIDNNSPDHTSEVAEDFARRNPHFQAFLETQVGHTYTRNRGIEESQADWLLFLDDDLLAPENLIEKTLEIAREGRFRMFGGKQVPWYFVGRTRWFKDRYIRVPKYRVRSRMAKGETVTGFCMAIHRSLFKEFEAFRLDLGMKGEKIGYADETEFQDRLHKADEPIGFDPELYVNHLVPQYKQTVDWQLEAAFATGRDIVRSRRMEPGLYTSLKAVFIALVMSTLNIIRYTPRLLAKDYYIENWLIDCFRKVVKWYAIAYTSLLLAYGSDELKPEVIR